MTVFDFIGISDKLCGYLIPDIRSTCRFKSETRSAPTQYILLKLRPRTLHHEAIVHSHAKPRLRVQAE